MAGRLEEAGFEFRFRQLDQALAEIFGRTNG
ncbi:MAG: DUF1731 domain-containing protein [Wenzhouxiangella sp.]